MFFLLSNFSGLAGRHGVAIRRTSAASSLCYVAGIAVCPQHGCAGNLLYSGLLFGGFGGGAATWPVARGAAAVPVTAVNAANDGPIACSWSGGKDSCLALCARSAQVPGSIAC